MITTQSTAGKPATGNSWLRQVFCKPGPRPRAHDDDSHKAWAQSATPPANKTEAKPCAPCVHRFDAAGWGHTVLVDSDGHGVIQLGGVTLGECEPAGKGAWVDASRDFCLFTIKRAGGRTDLAICKRGDPAAGSILVHDWSPVRSLGIRLGA